MNGIYYSLKTLVAKADFESPTPTHVDVPYATTHGRRVLPRVADLYLPGTGGLRPGVLFVHGGGFVIGSRKMKAMRLLAKHVRAAGFAVASIEYRMIGRGGRLEEGVQDVVAALRWWTSEGPATYGVRPGPISILGLSAGATLSLLATEQVGPEVVDSVVSVFGLYDFGETTGPAGFGLRRLIVRSADPDEWASSSPLARPVNVPVTMLHGTADRTVNVAQAEALYAARTQAGLPTTYHRYEGARHAFFNFERVPPSEEAMGDVLAALRRAVEARTEPASEAP